MAAEAAAYIRNTIDVPLSAGILTGTGMSGLLDDLDITHRFTYETLPNFPVSTVEGHRGELVIARLDKTFVLVMQGRFHLYEGYSPYEVTFPVRVMQELGVSTLLVSNAAGGMAPGFKAGDIMVIRDHVNLTGQNPLVGPNTDAWGVRFPDMTHTYDPALTDLALATGRDMGLAMQQGVYAGLLGPSLETPAEIRFLKTIGCDAVGLSTVMEVIAAVHAGMKVLGLSLITNINTPDNPSSTSLEEVLATASRFLPDLNRLTCAVLKRIPA